MQGQRVDALREFARLSRLKFDKGVAGYLEVLIAENELFAPSSRRRACSRHGTRSSSASTRPWAAAGWTSPARSRRGRRAWRPHRRCR